jgi:phosphoenolpyruvate carboxykinase (ATP)
MTLTSPLTAPRALADFLARFALASRNASAAALVELALQQPGVRLSADGAVVVDTGQFTGRSPKDKFIVRDDLTADRVWWDNSASMTREAFDRLTADVVAHLAEQPMHLQELSAGADPASRYGVSVYTPSAWHALFIRNLLIGKAGGEAVRQVTILHAPGFNADPERHGTRTGTAIALDMSRNIVVIAGTAYAGEIKKSVFSLFNFHAPSDGILPMHCSANVGADGKVALFFGLSGTGKTTLSNDPARPLIGDDEHGWSEDGVFNLEGGCYAKTARLDAGAEPEIFAAARRFATVLENVEIDEKTRVPDFDDIARTENTRAAYPLEALPSALPVGKAGVPDTVIFLTADAFGVLPPIARLDLDQAVYHFLSGYTAKLAGTERGVSEPQATFSACFGAPFMPLHPTVYGTMLREKLARSGASCWLINTGWTGGAYGTGRRMSIAATRAVVAAALSGRLDAVPMRRDERFGLSVPIAIEGVPDGLLDPRSTWADAEAYDDAAERLAGLFRKNFERFGLDGFAAAGPRLLAAQ